MRLIIVWTNNI